MRLIKSMPSKKTEAGNWTAMGLFWCEECKSEALKARSRALVAHTCGCGRNKRKGNDKHKDDVLCLKCDKKFKSENKTTNRICPLCKNINHIIEISHSRNIQHSYSLGSSHQHAPKI